MNYSSSSHKGNCITIVIFPHNFQQGVSNVSLERKNDFIVADFNVCDKISSAFVHFQIRDLSGDKLFFKMSCTKCHLHAVQDVICINLPLGSIVASSVSLISSIYEIIFCKCNGFM